MNIVKEMFESGKIERFAQAEALMKSLRDNKMKDFDKRFGKTETATATKVEKKKEKEKDQPRPPPVDDEILVNKRHTSKDIVKVKNKRSELPTFEVQLFNDYTDF